jgi:hypothetical protein
LATKRIAGLRRIGDASGAVGVTFLALTVTFLMVRRGVLVDDH